MGRGKKRAKTTSSPSKHSSSPHKKAKQSTEIDDGIRLIEDPIPELEAKSRWPHRYNSKSETTSVSITLSDGSTEEKVFFQAKCHYSKAIVDGVLFNLNDNAFIQASDGEPEYVAKIVEMFETVKNEAYVCTRWFYRAKDTVIKDQDYLIDKKRVFYSDVKDDNPLSCINSKAKIAELRLSMDKDAREKAIKSFDLFVDMMYSFPHAFSSLYIDTETASSCIDGLPGRKNCDGAKSAEGGVQKPKTTLLDLYSGCGAMSSGLSLGALLAGENVVTRWAVDFNSYACESLKFNHPNTEVRNEDAKDYFLLLVEWEKLCKEFNLLGSEERDFVPNETDSDDSEVDNGLGVSSGEYEVEKLVAICFGDPNKKKRGLYFKVHWKDYGRDHDTWEPIDGLSNCKEKIKDFVAKGHKTRILPLPGDVDFMCGGPPCQGISGHNRYRKVSNPLEDEKNGQLIVFMNIAEFLKPRYLLMENVTDILKFSKGLLTHYALGRLVSMNYQARLGIMAAGAYGVPQCRMRVFLWGAGPTEILPQFPLPTHEVMKKGVVINEFKENIVAHVNGQGTLLKTVLLGDAISDLPKVSNSTHQEEMPYGSPPVTDFQKFIRLTRHDVFGSAYAKKNDPHKSLLYDHRPLPMSTDDYQRVLQIPKVKGANFRNLPGLIVGPNKVVKLDPSVKRPLLDSGKPLVPDYALSFEAGKSSKPFGRLSQDDVVATVVGRAKPHNQILLHWDQDRVLTIRENARLQGFPDCYWLFGPLAERYVQIGNAVSFSASIPLGYCLAKAMQGANTNTPLKLPFKFPDCLGQLKSIRRELDS